MSENPLDRTVQFVGREGQDRLRAAHVAVVGVGGLGTHVVQQLAFLRVGRLSLIDSEELKSTSRNRYVVSRWDDVGKRKVDVARAYVLEVEPTTDVQTIHESLVSNEAFAAIRGSDYVFGCLDSDGARLVLNELCSAYARPYIDVATEIPPEDPRQFGGRVCVARKGEGCLYCIQDALDRDEAQRVLGGPNFVRDQEQLYGVRAAELPGGGPAVVTVNGVVASLATTEFLLWATGRREPKRLIKYRGESAKVTVSVDSPEADCYYCRSVYGQCERANVERYIAAGMGAWLR